MNQFFTVYLYDVTNNETIWFSKPNGSATDIVILDEGWAPNITKYVRDGEKTWGDVVEELECMTNVETRDEALALIEKLNVLVHRAARDIEEKQEYTVRFVVQSQFSTAQNEAFTHVVSPLDDGNVISLSTNIQTAPPGQIRFKFTFKRTGAWIVSETITHSGVLTSDITPSSGYWKLQTTLPTVITQPTPVSLTFLLNDNSSYDVWLHKLFFCVNVTELYVIDYFDWEAPFDMDIVILPYWMFATANMGYVIKDSTDNYTTDKRPFTFVNFQKGTYAVFLFWKPNQPHVAHRFQVQFDNNTETSNIILLSDDTRTQCAYVGTITMTQPASILYLRTRVGHSTGFIIEKLVFVKLKTTSNIVSLGHNYFTGNTYLTIENTLLSPIKTFVRSWGSNYYQKEVIKTYESLDIVADNQSFNIVLVGNSRDVFSLRKIGGNYDNINSIPVTISYRDIRTIFH